MEMTSKDMIVELKNKKKIFSILLYLLGFNFFISYTVFIYLKYTLGIIYLDSLIIQLTSMIIFIYLLYRLSHINKYIEFLIDPLSLFIKKDYYNISNRFSILVILLCFVLTMYTILSQFNIVIKLIY